MGKVIDIGDAEGLDGHTAHTEQGLCHEHYSHRGQMLGLCVAGTATAIGGGRVRGQGCGQAQGSLEVLWHVP